MALRIGLIVNQARRYASQNPEKVTSGLDRVGDAVNSRTGGKHEASVTKAKDAVGKALGTSSGRGRRRGWGRGSNGR